jgi:hypothetical protein
MPEEGLNYYVIEWTAAEKRVGVFSSLEEARAAAKPGQEIWRGPRAGVGILEFVEKAQTEG